MLATTATASSSNNKNNGNNDKTKQQQQQLLQQHMQYCYLLLVRIHIRNLRLRATVCSLIIHELSWIHIDEYKIIETDHHRKEMVASN